MKTAIDFYERGKEKEANADEYNHLQWYSSDRFICPVCGERVFLTRGKYTNHFSHYKKKDQFQDCDRRVDGNRTESIYVRVGLPIYVSKESDKAYRLFLCFRPLQLDTLQQLNEHSVSVCIGSNSKYRINGERFFSDRSTWIPISDAECIKDSIPLSFSGDEKLCNGLIKYWGIHAEAFSAYGAVFFAESHNCKKLHTGDSISTGRSYLWITTSPDLFSGISGVTLAKDGYLLLDSGKYTVFKMQLCSELSDQEFNRLSRIMLDCFKLHLLEKTPAAIPIWPPLRFNGEGYLADPTVRTIYAHVESGNSKPKVYCYNGNNINAESINVLENGVILLNRSNSQTLVNIDRKTVSTGLYILERRTDGTCTLKEKRIDAHSENIYFSRFVCMEKKLTLTFSEKGDVVHLKKHGINFYSNASVVVFDELSDGDIILVYFSSMLTGIVTCSSPCVEGERVSTEKIRALYLMNMNTCKVCIPHSVRAFLQSITEKDLVINTVLSDGCIAKPLLAYLEGVMYGR